MIIADDCFLTSNENNIPVKSVEAGLEVADNTKVLSIRRHKKYKVMIKVIFNDDSYIIVGKNTYLQIVEEHDIGRIIEAKDVQPGQLLCPPLPPYADIFTWGSTYGIGIKKRQTMLQKVSTIVFDECEYININGIPVLHDNYEHRIVRHVARRSTSIGNLLLKYK